MIVDIDIDDFIATMEFCKAFRDHLQDCLNDNLVPKEDLPDVMDAIADLSGLAALYEKMLYLEAQSEKKTAVVH